MPTGFKEFRSKSEVINSKSFVALTNDSCDSLQWFSEEDPENPETTNQASKEIDERILQRKRKWIKQKKKPS